MKILAKLNKSMQPFYKISVFLIMCSFLSIHAQERPNIVILFADDLGYGDLSSYGAQDVNTPHIDQLAEEGLKFSDFQVPSSVCSPSRAALLTGRYPMRNGFPVARHTGTKHSAYGLDAEEITIASTLQQTGYSTMCIGKWHLGFMEGSHPMDHGFEEFFGLQSNWNSKSAALKKLYKNRTVVNEKVTYETLLESYTDEAIAFVKSNKEKPFFLYLAYNAVHSPILPSNAFKKSSKGGPYGDYVQELDHYVGKFTNFLSENGYDENTIIIFLSDNGPAICNFGGSAGPLNGGKYTTMEGGFRIPAIIKYKDKFATGINHTSLSSMDLYPTIANLAGAKVPSDRVIDGKDITTILETGKGKTPHEFIYYYNGINLQAVRKGPWKLHLPRTLEDQPFWSKKQMGKPFNGKALKTLPCKGIQTLKQPILIDLDHDMGELKDVSRKNPKIVEELLKEAERVRKELGDVNSVGTDQRLPPFKDIQVKQ
ncbi:sulfatase family protein [Winogradskyella eckloniae]|uniref:sulfatase family protein n=1 Tax=Winogradskyella eckloniae TaxID=1089306 RepID=UPI0019D59D51|nr:sulfatase [Winogradskyella eckloniae]